MSQINFNPMASPVSTFVQQQNAPPAASAAEMKPADAEGGLNEKQKMAEMLNKYKGIMAFNPDLAPLQQGVQELGVPMRQALRWLLTTMRQ